MERQRRNHERHGRWRVPDPAIRREVAEYFSFAPSYEFTDLEQRGSQADIEPVSQACVFRAISGTEIFQHVSPPAADQSGMGVDKFPRLANQHADYIQSQQRMEKRRHSQGSLNMMGNIAGKLTDDEIKNPSLLLRIFSLLKG